MSVEEREAVWNLLKSKPIKPSHVIEEIGVHVIDVATIFDHGLVAFLGRGVVSKGITGITTYLSCLMRTYL